MPKKSMFDDFKDFAEGSRKNILSQGPNAPEAALAKGAVKAGAGLASRFGGKALKAAGDWGGKALKGAEDAVSRFTKPAAKQGASNIKNPALKKAITDKIEMRGKSAPKSAGRGSSEETKVSTYRFDKAPKTKATRARNPDAPNKYRGHWSPDVGTKAIKRKTK